MIFFAVARGFQPLVGAGDAVIFEGRQIQGLVDEDKIVQGEVFETAVISGPRPRRKL